MTKQEKEFVARIEKVIDKVEPAYLREGFRAILKEAMNMSGSGG